MAPPHRNPLNGTRLAGWNKTMPTVKPVAPRAGVAVAELLRRAAEEKNSFGYLWSSPIFKWTLISVIVVLVLVRVFLGYRWRCRRQMGY